MARRYAVVLAATAFFWPAAALADVRITQIMYDPPGANAGHQWIQVTNLGGTPENITGYKLFQNGTNHGISVALGTTTIPAGAVAILASKPEVFRADYPNFGEYVFKVSFSLRAAGDSLVLKDTKLQPVDVAAYSSSEGASGDGNALYLSGGAWVPGAPDPGSYHATAPAALAPAAPNVPAPKSTKTPAAGKVASAAQSKGSRSISSNSAPPAGTALAAAGATGTPTASLLEIVAGSAAFGLVVVAGLLLRRRLEPAPVPVKSESEPPRGNEVAASEYDISDSTNSFL